MAYNPNSIVDPAMLRDAYMLGDYGRVNSMIGDAGISQAGMSNLLGNMGYDPQGVLAEMSGRGINFAASGTPQENVGYNFDAGPSALPAASPVGNVGGAYGGFGGGPVPTLDTSYTPNPYLDQIYSGMQTQANNNLQRNILPGIRGNAVATGGVGGSRQGLAEGMAIGDTQAGLSSAYGNLYGSDFNNSQNRNLQKYQADQGYTLGQGGLANSRYSIEGQQNLGNQGQLMNFYTQQRGQDQADVALGANLYGLGTQGQWSPINNANSAYSPYTGFGATTQSSQQGGGLLGGIGGAMAGGSFGRQMGWW